MCLVHLNLKTIVFIVFVKQCYFYKIYNFYFYLNKLRAYSYCGKLHRTQLILGRFLINRASTTRPPLKGPISFICFEGVEKLPNLTELLSMRMKSCI